MTEPLPEEELGGAPPPSRFCELEPWLLEPELLELGLIEPELPDPPPELLEPKFPTPELPEPRPAPAAVECV